MIVPRMAAVSVSPGVRMPYTDRRSASVTPAVQHTAPRGAGLHARQL